MEKPDLPVLTGLRLVAALSVVMAHGSVIVLFTDARWIPIIGFGLAYFGMSLFFVLSGFVIYLNYAPQFAKLPIGEAALRFAVARFARLYPLYAFFMLISLATISWSRVPAMLPDLYWFVPMLQSWFLGNGQYPIMFTFKEVALTWSISTELFFYMAFPLLLLFLPRRIHRLLELPLLLVGAAAVLIGLYFVVPHFPTPQAQQWLPYYSPYCRIFEFAAGMLTARLYLSPRHADWRPRGDDCRRRCVRLRMLHRGQRMHDQKLATRLDFLVRFYSAQPMERTGQRLSLVLSGPI
jgi:peptidoglycan/LPS O-acetylase OafA/YrhL